MHIMDETTAWFNEQVAALKPGTVLGNKYILIEQVGRGGMGVVWQAKDRVADRLVTLKFVPNDLQRFEEEMRRVGESFQKSMHCNTSQSVRFTT